jgi:hypothetical protein
MRSKEELDAQLSAAIEHAIKMNDELILSNTRNRDDAIAENNAKCASKNAKAQSKWEKTNLFYLLQRKCMIEKAQKEHQQALLKLQGRKNSASADPEAFLKKIPESKRHSLLQAAGRNYGRNTTLKDFTDEQVEILKGLYKKETEEALGQVKQAEEKVVERQVEFHQTIGSFFFDTEQEEEQEEESLSDEEYRNSEEYKQSQREYQERMQKAREKLAEKQKKKETPQGAPHELPKELPKQIDEDVLAALKEDTPFLELRRKAQEQDKLNEITRRNGECTWKELNSVIHHKSSYSSSLETSLPPSGTIGTNMKLPVSEVQPPRQELPLPPPIKKIPVKTVIKRPIISSCGHQVQTYSAPCEPED